MSVFGLSDDRLGELVAAGASIMTRCPLMKRTFGRIFQSSSRHLNYQNIFSSAKITTAGGFAKDSETSV